ncbi:uncharacterized protein LOC126790563 isoform X2 [Argentina anserina]|uniref:uncharacterized protein LOC126790563 isoform X2 n=1 Tax=Argentina anserina TaxID=57926 RepID=UPI00217655DB|nr:uncharacterized protein LOC126790563 isoform X2 [Potentilla anserina]
MGLLGLLGFALQCFDVLAWPLFAMLYPLYSSIKAIETNSITDTHKLNTYWVVFSLILLFEHAFMKFLEWFLLWQYIRLLIVFILVMPRFDGALYVYRHLIYPCFSMGPQIVLNLFNKRKESLLKDNFPSENGPEGLVKFIAGKSKFMKPNGEQKDIKAVQVSLAEPNVTVNEDNFSSRRMNEKVIEVAVDRKDNPPPKKVQKEPTTVSPLPTQTDAISNSPLGDNKHKATYEALEIKNEAVQKLTWPENRIEKPDEVGTGIEDPESPKEVQKEWTCALCQVTTISERTLNFHLSGRKHKVAYEALKAKNQAKVPKIAPASTAKTSHQPNQEPGKSIRSSESKAKGTVNQNVQGQKNTSPSATPKKCCKLTEEVAETVSSNVQKGKTAIPIGKVHSQQPKPNEVPRVKRSGFWCEICSIRCPGEIDMRCHLSGKKHKENMQERQENLIKIARMNMPSGPS